MAVVQEEQRLLFITIIITCEQENKIYIYLSSVLVIGVPDRLLVIFKVPRFKAITYQLH